MRRRHASMLSVAVLLAIVISSLASCSAFTQNHVSVRWTPPDDSWRRLHVGMKVYLGQDQASLSSQNVCQTWKQYYEGWQRGHWIGCKPVKHGTPAIVVRIIKKSASEAYRLYGDYEVEIRAIDGSWSGITGVGGLQPDVPVGTIFAMERDLGASLGLAKHADGDRDQDIEDIGDRANVRVLRYEPLAGAHTLYVEVLDGPHRGEKGWMGIQDARTFNETKVSIFGLEY